MALPIIKVAGYRGLLKAMKELPKYSTAKKDDCLPAILYATNHEREWAWANLTLRVNELVSLWNSMGVDLVYVQPWLGDAYILEVE